MPSRPWVVPPTPLTRSSNLRADYDEELGQLVIAGNSDWNGRAEIWVDEGKELVNYGPLDLEDSIQLLSAPFFGADWTVSLRERVIEEERDVLRVGQEERLAAADISLDEVPWSNVEDVQDVEKTFYCVTYMMPVLSSRGQACRVRHCKNGHRSIVACWYPGNHQ